MPAILLALISSRVGQISLALIVGWTIGWWRTDASWREHVAREAAVREAVYQAELQRQKRAAEIIAQAANERMEYEKTRADDMAARIRQLELAEAIHEPQQQSKLICKDASGKLTPVVIRPCRLDSADVDFLRSLDAGNSKANPARAASPFRKAR